MKNYKKFIEDNTIRLDASGRGGGIEIDISNYLKIDDAKMSAYQNYLGGGMLGAVQSDCNLDVESLSETKQTKIYKLADELKKYFFDLTNHDDEWEHQSFIQNQSMPSSAY